MTSALAVKLENDLYPDQQLASDQFFDWLEKNEGLVAGLWASAGFGKSHLCKHLVEGMKEAGYHVGVTSMTHAAVEVLSKLSKLEVRTLHSTMGWIPSWDRKTGEEYPKVPRENKCPLIGSGIQILLVDEAGLMGHEELKLLIERASIAKVRLLFVGDHKQCFPVTKDHERLCIPAHEAKQVYLYLTTPKRVDEDDMLYKLCTAYRRTVDGERQPKLRTVLNPDNSGKGVYIVDDVEEAAYKAFHDAKEKGEDLRKIKVLAYTNRRSLALNRKIRREVFGIKDNRPYVGEEVQANTTISDSLDKEILIRNNQLLTVLEVQDGKEHGMEGWWLEVEDCITGERVSEAVFVASSFDTLKQHMDMVKNQALSFKRAGKAQQAQERWFKFYLMKKFFADIRNTYAITVNKCQGSTLTHALLDLDNIGSCRSEEQAARMAYTGVSRATDKVTIEGSLEVSDWRKRVS